MKPNVKTRLLAKALAALLCFSAFAGCSRLPAPPGPAQAPETVAEPATPPEAPEGKPYIAVIAKGFKHQFWQTVYAGAKDASAKYDVEITFDGPDSEEDFETQIAMMDSALRKKPDAIALAALDAFLMEKQIKQAMAENIPIIAFETGASGAPEGAVISTAGTDQTKAGALAAQEMFNESRISGLLEKATPEEPVIVGVLLPEENDEAVAARATGFIDEFFSLAEGMYPGAVDVYGHSRWRRDAEEAIAVYIEVAVSESPESEDMQAAALKLLKTSEHLAGVFCASEPAANALLAATADGADLDRSNGEYGKVAVIGFDSGDAQQNAVRNGYFYGAVTQDAYMIGYLAVEQAVKAINGGALEEVADAGAKFYTSVNMDSPEIASLLY